ncbi:MAG: carboxypeptidase regulatory-like domain-containing protein, partial [Pyrinomonadaceae bacterium]
RHDVVAHSQGGLLSRMLVSRDANDFVFVPFRNSSNFYRGRFRRVVTIGSPHNGTRIPQYMFALQERRQNPNGRPSLAIPAVIADFFIVNGTAQTKFNPVGEQIALISRSDPDAPWLPDPDAKIHLVQTTVNLGQPPDSKYFSYSDAAMGLNSPNGALVIPHGSDGVVDFDSMGATTPQVGQVFPDNVFRFNLFKPISHAYVGLPTGEDLFAGISGQVLYYEVAEHVIGALDQDPSLAPEDRIFGPFRLPLRVPQSVVDDIDQAAANIVPDRPNSIMPADARPSNKSRVGSTVEYRFVLPEGQELLGPVFWTLERYGADGATLDNGSLTPSQLDPSMVSVNVDESIPGDRVLYGTATTTSGITVIGTPAVVASVEPDPGRFALSSIKVSPGGGSFPVGAAVEPLLSAIYTDTQNPGQPLTLRRWLEPSDMIVSSTNTGVVDITNKLSWSFASVGQAVVHVAWRGNNAHAAFSIYDPEQTQATIFGQVTTPGGQPIRNATVSLSNGRGTRYDATTSTFGYFHFEGERNFDQYVLAVNSRRYRFAPRSIAVRGDQNEIVLVAQE